MNSKSHVLITGVSTGIGYAAVKYLISQGYFVFGSVRKKADQEKLMEVFPENFMCLLFDVTDVYQIRDSFEAVKQQLKGTYLIGLINNAGLSYAGPISLIPDDQFEQQVKVNLFGVRNVTNVFLPLLGMETNQVGKPGKIINISSMSGVFNTPFNGSYCVSKHALQSLSETYRRELLDYEIDVVSILPGPVKSEIWEKNRGIMSAYETSDYGEIAKNADEYLKQAVEKALPAENIAQLINKVLHKKKPKTNYWVAKNVFFMRLAIKYIPSRWMDRLIWSRLKKLTK